MKLNKNPKKLVEPLVNKIDNQQLFLEEVGQGMVDQVRKRIERTKRDAEGNKWAPWAPSTRLQRKKERTLTKGLLFRTGALSESITYTVQGPKVSVSTDIPYAQYLQNGTSKMPARPFLGQGKSEEKLITQLWQKWMES